MKTLLKRFAIALGMTALIYVGIALGLIVSQSPAPLPARAGLDFSATLSTPPEGFAPTQYTARDGTDLPVRMGGPVDAASVVVIVHGSGWHGGGYLQLAAHLAGQGHRVLVPDLRGHGSAPKRRGDLDLIGQLEEDLADLIDQHSQAGQNRTLIGHSSGGGLVIRFAGGAYGDRMDRAVLIAPFLKYNAPTMRPNSGGWAWPLTRRIVGLTMLNQVGITALNHLTAIQFNFPQTVLQGPLGQTATQSYSFRMNTSFAPRSDYLSDVAALPDFLLIAGAEDEAFAAEAFQETLSAASLRGDYAILPGLSHLSVLDAPAAFERIDAFLND